MTHQVSTVAPVPVISIVNNQTITSSLDVAEYFGKRHDHVLRDIKNIIDQEPEFGLPNFGEMQDVVSTNNRGTISRVFYNMTKDGFVFLAMGFTGAKARKFKILYIEAFNAMEAQLVSNPLQLEAPALTASQIGELATLIAERFTDGRDRPYAWGRFNNHFRLASYKDLPPHRFEEACRYIRTIPPKAQPQIALIAPPVDDNQNYRRGVESIENIQSWALLALTGRNQDQVLEYCRQAKASLVRGWTEMDEALLRITVAMSFLRRWRDG